MKKIKILEEGKIGTRPSFDELYMALAIDMSSKSSCFNVHAGAVVVCDKNRVRGLGYNGAPSRLESCYSLGECVQKTKTGEVYGYRRGLHKCIGEHSERNAVLSAMRIGEIDGFTLYNTIAPCKECTIFLIGSGVDRVVFKRDYLDEEFETSIELFRKAKVKVERLDLSPWRKIDIDFWVPRQDMKLDVWSPEQREWIDKLNKK